MKEIVVKEVLGVNPSIEDAIILKEMINDSLDESITLDFSELQSLPCAFFANLLTDIMYKRGREKVISNLKVKNLTNKRDFDRILLGTSYC
ncbi:STAS-like domain-containing protein [Clostridium brassicae]|uniref:DUF4325 domain-containing protein n=1 Tax=Clostridium brassicae TaxID=2999072 RepID=A0ABT4D5E1_9CLOT|nr:DUF4325 domain-containing protein [Clostridium brassicae]MCY6957505.1 DUF4325 domain-containing protein [Clostridium brassicae]